VEDAFVLTVSFSLYFLRPVSEGVLHAEGEVISASRVHFVASSILTVDGKEVARSSGTFLESKRKLAEIEGYR
jgi:acyl-coenzyme A thioesterase PaaI-like protein